MSCRFPSFSLLLMGLLFWSARAQPGLEAYDRGDLSAVKAYLSTHKNHDAEILFLQAALTVEADSALEQYRAVVLTYPESPISKRALERICQYYEAQGRLDKAQEFEKALRGFQTPPRRLEPSSEPLPAPAALSQAREADSAPALSENPETEPRSARFSLQVGAFSNPANAQQLRAVLVRNGYSVEILAASQSQNRLHTVFLRGYGDEIQARRAADKLLLKMGIKAIIVPDARAR